MLAVFLLYGYFQNKSNKNLKNILLIAIKRLSNFDTTIDFLHFGFFPFFFFFYFSVLIVYWHPKYFAPIENTMMKLITHSDRIF